MGYKHPRLCLLLPAIATPNVSLPAIATPVGLGRHRQRTNSRSSRCWRRERSPARSANDSESPRRCRGRIRQIRPEEEEEEEEKEEKEEKEN